MQRPVIKHVDFDLDGTLCHNTEVVAFNGIREAMLADIPALDEILPSAYELTQFAGFQTHEVIDMIIEQPYCHDALQAVDKQEFSKGVFANTVKFQLQSMEQQAEALEGIDDILSDPALNVGIVSTSQLPRITASLLGCKLNGLKYDFQPHQIISADETVKEMIGVPQPKPNPTSYLLSVYQNAYQPYMNGEVASDTLFQFYRVEDSVSGAKAAQHAAGRFDGTHLTERKTTGQELLAQEKLAPFKDFLEKQGQLDSFAAFLDNNVESHTIGVDSCSHVAPDKKPAHRQKLLDMGVDTVVSTAAEIKRYIMNT